MYENGAYFSFSLPTLPVPISLPTSYHFLILPHLIKLKKKNSHNPIMPFLDICLCELKININTESIMQMFIETS